MKKQSKFHRFNRGHIFIKSEPSRLNRIFVVDERGICCARKANIHHTSEAVGTTKMASVNTGASF